MGRPAAFWQTVKILRQPATWNQQIRRVHGSSPTAPVEVHRASWSNHRSHLVAIVSAEWYCTVGLLNAFRGALMGAFEARSTVLFRCVSATRPSLEGALLGRQL